MLCVGDRVAFLNRVVMVGVTYPENLAFEQSPKGDEIAT